jgi:aminopeptidase N
MTQMPGPNSQSWPGLVFLSSMSFLTPEERARLHVGPYGEVVYGRVMPAHETAHQWWGDLLIWKSYREQWLVEALSEYCVLLRLEQQDAAAFRLVMDHYRHDLLQQNKNGRAVTEAGPVTLGVRLDSSQFPRAFDEIAYGRGAWLFHMLHHMLLDANEVPASQPSLTGRRQRKPAAADDPFFTVLRGLRQRFEGKEINTRDVQQAFEDALPESLRYEGRKSLEWFFDGWVNGVSIPSLQLQAVKLTHRGAGLLATGKVAQKDAPPDLVTSVPLYAELAETKKLVLLGRIFAEGSETSFRFNVPPEARRIILDPFATVLTRP